MDLMDLLNQEIGIAQNVVHQTSHTELLVSNAGQSNLN